MREAGELPADALVTTEGGEPAPARDYAGRLVKWTKEERGKILVMLEGPRGARGTLVRFEDEAVYRACVGTTT